MRAWESWKTEAAMVADFGVWVAKEGIGNRNRDDEPWTVYAETAGWDLLLVRNDGFQIGVEAKLKLNATVLCQVLAHDRYADRGPDCHAVLVPESKTVNGLSSIARHLGVVVIQASAPAPNPWGKTEMPPRFGPHLPRRSDHIYDWREEWPERCPDRRCMVPEYVPDVCGGKPAPVTLTPWKIAAIKAQVIIETRGYITRSDFKALKINSSRWTQFWLKSNGEGGWIPDGMPDFRAQHPLNYEQIKVDQAKWMPKSEAVQASLLGASS